jgi:hypothetical protein
MIEMVLWEGELVALTVEIRTVICERRDTGAVE